MTLLAVRIGALGDSTHVARAVGATRRAWALGRTATIMKVARIDAATRATES